MRLRLILVVVAVVDDVCCRVARRAASLRDALSMSFFDAPANGVISSSDDDEEEEEREHEVHAAGARDAVVDAPRGAREKDDAHADVPDDAGQRSARLPSAADVVTALERSQNDVCDLVHAASFDARMREAALGRLGTDGSGATPTAKAYYAAPVGDDAERGERRAATIHVDVHRVRVVPLRVARRMERSEGNGMLAEVKRTGARTSTTRLDEDEEDEETDQSKARVSITGKADDVNKCVLLLESLVREDENSSMKRFYCPKVVLGAFIGKGRGHLNKIERVSKCRVVISDEQKVHEGQTHAVVQAVEIHGTNAQVALGYRLALQNLDAALQSAPDVDEAKLAVRESGLDIEDERRKTKKPKITTNE